MTIAAKLIGVAAVASLTLWALLLRPTPHERVWYGCVDAADNCAARLERGHCRTQRDDMHMQCRATCQFCDHYHMNCHDRKGECAAWAAAGECEKNAAFMMFSCQKACNACGACVRVYSPGVTGRFAVVDGMLRNGRNVFRSNGGSGEGGSKLIYRDAKGAWVIALERDEEKVLLQCTRPTMHPFDTAAMGAWAEWNGPRQAWVVNSLISVEEVDCASADPDEAERIRKLNVIPDVVQQASTAIQQGVHYRAAYDIENLKPPTQDYAYPSDPRDRAFTYPEDRPEGLPPIPYKIVSHMPKAYYFPRFITDEEADDLRASAEPKMARSGVVPIKGEKAHGVEDVRTSDGAWLHNEMPSVERVRRRILQFTGFAPNQTEMLHVLRYREGGKYNSHHDFFHPHGARSKEEAERLWDLKWPQQWNRAATFFMYLADTDAGGETTLPRANGGPDPPTLTDCSPGLAVYPRKGAALLFYDLRPDKQPDMYSLHGGCPVARGVKWAAPQWLHVKVREKGAPIDEAGWR